MGRARATLTVLAAALVGTAACTSLAPAPPPEVATAATVDPPPAAIPSGPLRLAYAAAAPAGAPAAARAAAITVVADAKGIRLPSGQQLAWPAVTDEDSGVFGYALRETPITTAAGEPLGRLSADARVSVAGVSTAAGADGAIAERAEIVLFAWTPASGARGEGPLHAFVPARSLAAAPVSDAAEGLPPAGPKTREARSIALRDARWETLTYTFCGPLEVLGESATRGLSRVEQTDHGVTLIGLVEDTDLKNESGPARCTRPLLVNEDATTRLLVNGHGRRYTAAEPPPGLRTTDRRGPKLASVVSKRKEIFWVVDDGAAPRCEGWIFGPPHAGLTPLTSRQKLENGEERVTSFQTTVIPGSSDTEELLTVAGPTSEVIGRGGTERRHESVGGACNRQYVLVGSDATSFDLFGGHVPPHASIVAYSAADAERWFRDKAACEAALEGAAPAYRAAGFAPHDACP